MDLKNRRVARFRCHIDPMVGSKPKNAFDMREMKGSHFELTPIGVYAKVKMVVPGNVVQWEEHVIPYANVQSIKLMSPEEVAREVEAQAQAQLSAVA